MRQKVLIVCVARYGQIPLQLFGWLTEAGGGSLMC